MKSNLSYLFEYIVSGRKLLMFFNIIAVVVFTYFNLFSNKKERYQANKELFELSLSQVNLFNFNFLRFSRFILEIFNSILQSSKFFDRI
jgi:hypothetical protein